MTTPGIVTIDKERALDLLDAAVRAKGEYTKAEGMYLTPAGTPWCLIGTALYLGGVTVEQLRSIEGWPIRRAVEDGLTKEWLSLTDEAVTVFREAQNCQDNATTWGVAYHTARRIARTLP